MPKKNVLIEAELDEKFKLTSKLGGHTVYADQPAEQGGTDAGPNPLQYFLFSLAGCIAAVSRIAASQKKIDMKSMKLSVSGELNTDALLGRNTGERSGFPSIEVVVDIDAEMSAEEKKAFLDEVELRCPIADNVLNGADIKVSVA